MLTRTICSGARAAALALGLTFLALTGCAVTGGQQSVGSYMDDATITGSVKSEFAADSGIPGTAISVETLKGQVLLSGFVKTQAEKDRAGAVASKVKGVTSVKNDIVVRP
jgi:osmotically-inducible protein OsmY